MKKLHATLTLCALGISSIIYAQSTVKITQLVPKVSPLKSIQVTGGFAWDRYDDISMGMLADKTVDMPDFETKTEGMKQNISYFSVGLNTGVNLTWSQPKMSNSVITTEFRTGAAVNLMKESLISYYGSQGSSKQNVMYCFVENDVKVNSDLLFRLGDHRKFTIYSGIGVNASSSFDNQLIEFNNYNVEEGVINDFSSNSGVLDQNTYKGKNVVYGRAYIPVGASVKLFRHLEASGEVKIGRGIEQVVGGNASTFRTGEFNIGLRYNIQRNKALSIFDLF